MELPRLETPTVSAYIDMPNKLVYITYRGELQAETTLTLYRWMNEIIIAGDITLVRGSIYDFREVTHIPLANLTAVQKESSKLNVRVDMSHIPVALIVGNTQQEQMVRVAMRITPDEHRKRIVKSQEEAIAFIEWWQKKYGNTSAEAG